MTDRLFEWFLLAGLFTLLGFLIHFYWWTALIITPIVGVFLFAHKTVNTKRREPVDVEDVHEVE